VGRPPLPLRVSREDFGNLEASDFSHHHSSSGKSAHPRKVTGPLASCCPPSPLRICASGGKVYMSWVCPGPCHVPVVVGTIKCCVRIGRRRAWRE